MSATRAVTGVGVCTGDGAGATTGVMGGVGGALGWFGFGWAGTLFFRDGFGVGVWRGCAIELPSLLKKSPTGLPPRAKSPAAINPAAVTTKIVFLKQRGIASEHCALLRPVFNVQRSQEQNQGMTRATSRAKLRRFFL